MQDYWSHIRVGQRWNPTTGTWQTDAKLTQFKLDLDGGKQLFTTGYSLSGNLATAFTLMHEPEATTTYLFNAAGTGRMTSLTESNQERPGGTTGAAISTMIAFFTQVLLDPAHNSPNIPVGDPDPHSP